MEPQQPPLSVSQELLRSVLVHLSLIRQNVADCLGLTSPQPLMENLARLPDLARTISEKSFAGVTSLILEKAAALPAASASKPRPAVCLRRAGCTCIQCMPEEIKQETKVDVPKTPAQFAKAPIEVQMRILESQPELFRTFYDHVLLGDSLDYTQTFEEETFLAAINNLAMQERREVLVRDLIRSGTFWHMVALSVGHSDNMRWRALQLMLSLGRPSSLGLPFPLQNDAVVRLSDKVYTQRYDLDFWIGEFAGITFRTAVLPLSPEEMAALKKFCVWAKKAYMQHVNDCLKTANGIKMPESWFGQAMGAAQVPESAKAVAEGLRLKLDKVISEFGNAAFVKLSTRSPKDSYVLPHREKHRYVALLSQGLAEPSAREWAETECLRVHSGTEALDLLIASQRVEDDLDTTLDWGKATCSAEALSSSPMSVVVREWARVPRWGEFRSFVCKGKLNAVTQYFCDRMFPLLVKQKEEVAGMIKKFFEEQVGPRLRKLAIAHAVVDFGLVLGADERVEKIIVLELNSFGVRSGAGLFDWDREEDLRTMICGPFEFRMIERAEQVEDTKPFLSVCRCDAA